jgi:hypothetical protein
MTLRNCRPLMVLAMLALSGCPMNFRFNVENGPGDTVASRSEPGHVAVASAGAEARRAPPPQNDSEP